VSDFGTRRHGLWQEYVVKAMSDVLGSSFTGTSNTYLAYKHDLEAIGTNAHELPMALAAMAKDDEELEDRAIPLAGALAADLPRRVAHSAARATFERPSFSAAPGLGGGLDGAARGQQDPFLAGDEYIAWLNQRNRDPRQNDSSLPILSM
jgi:nicotinate phosphoribosyltransferase